MSFCTQCGFPLPQGAASCPRCNASLGSGGHGRNDVWIIGRSSECDVVLDFPTVSSRHCRVARIPGGFEVEDLSSTNGTHVGWVGNRVVTKTRVPVDAVIFIGTYRFPLANLLAPRQGRLTRGAAAPAPALQLTARRQVIGRDPNADIVVDHPHVSRRHACIEVKGGNFILTDLGSANGTFVNGRRVRSAVLQPGDVVALGNHRFTFTPDRNLAVRNYSGDVTVCADSLWVAVKDSSTKRRKVLLENISFTVYPGELVGIMGPSGSGKTTLLYAMLGIIRPARGRCLLNEMDMLREYDQLRPLIGYVPQDDIIHPELTVREVLTYAGRLRLPADTTKEELEARVQRTLELVNLKDAADVLVGSPEKKGISGGQRKRLNIALELLTEPSLIFLDEPTSGLSSEDALSLIQELRTLTNAGRTVILTIHQPGYRIYSTLDNVLILVSKTLADKEAGVQGALPGRVAYYGPAVANYGSPANLRDDSITFFNPEVAKLPQEERGEVLKDPEAPLAGMERKPSSYWVERYRSHPLHNEYVASRRRVAPGGRGSTASRRRTPANPVRQWWVLTERYALTKLRDMAATLGLLAQAPIIALLFATVFDRKDPYDTPIFLLPVVAIWFGCINSVTEIIKEKAIFKRERMIFLQLVPYVMSKVAVLGLLSIVQSAILLSMLKWALAFKGAFLPMLGIMFLCCLGGLAMGLLLSAVRPTLGSAMSILPIVLTVQIVLGGAMQPLPNMDVLPKPLRIPQWFAQVTLSRWGYEALLSIEEKARRKKWLEENCIPPPCSFQPPVLSGRAGVPVGPGQGDNVPENSGKQPRVDKPRQKKGVCMEFPQVPVCCKFQRFQLKGKPEDQDVQWKETCTAKSRFETWKEVPLSSIPGNACALLAIVVASFVGVILALKLKD